MPYTTTLFLLVAALLVGCRTTIPDLPATREAVITYMEGGTYQADVEHTVASARRSLHRHLDHPQPAIVLDIDDTVITTYHLQKKMGFGFCYDALKAWRIEANAPAIPAMKALYDDALATGVAVFFVTGRRDRDRTSTEANLATAGFSRYTRLYTKPDTYNEASTAPFKRQCRAQIEADGYTIILNIGDQESDLTGGHAIHSYKLPNPYYRVD